MYIEKVGNQSYYKNDVKTKDDTLGKDAFIKMLIAQMTNQDPMNPADDKELITQTAQFSNVEQMASLADSMEANKAYSLIGRTIYAEVNAVEGTLPFAGKVDAVIKHNGAQYYRIGSDNVPVDSLRQVHEATDETNDVIAAADLLGRIVRVTHEYEATVVDENGNTVYNDDGSVMTVTQQEIVNGTVEQVYSRDGVAYMLIDDVEVAYRNVSEMVFFQDLNGLREAYKDLINSK